MIGVVVIDQRSRTLIVPHRLHLADQDRVCARAYRFHQATLEHGNGIGQQGQTGDARLPSPEDEPGRAVAVVPSAEMVGQLLVGTLADFTGTPAAVAIACALSILCVIAIARRSPAT